MGTNTFRWPLIEWAKSIQKRLNSEYEESKSVLSHPGAIGVIREEIIRNILESFLPPSIQIGTGQIIDSTSNLSNQVDIVLARGTAPAFRFKGNITAFLYETVYATIEIKSMLYRDKLIEALDNSRSVKELTYLLNVRAKGRRIFDEAFNWVDSIGGISQLDLSLQEPNLENTLDCPEEIWKVIFFVYFWLHWEKGDFTSQETVEKMRPFLQRADFDLFANLIAFLLKEADISNVLSKEYQKSKIIRAEFFNKLFECLHYDDIPPHTFVLAYGGYENLETLVTQVKNWYDQNRTEVEWWQLPKVILNHKMLMYRTFNEYHCHEFDYPVLYLINAIIEILVQDLHYPVSYGLTTGLTPYFDLGVLLGPDHPRFSPTYFVWSLPFDNSSAGEIIFPKSQQKQNDMK